MGMSPRGSVGQCGAVALCSAAILGAPQGGLAQVPLEAPALRIEGPPPPEYPDVVSRDDRGGATIRAVRLTERPFLDGRLDEAWYHTVPPISGFIQSVPDEGAAATEETEVWIGFDDENIYVGARIWDSAPESEWIANELRRDTPQLRQNDSFGILFDTFYDRRNGVMFYTNPLGAMADFQVTNEGNPNQDWNPVWDVRTGRFEGGWTVEMEIPFKSLRYRPGREQIWGVQLRRAIRRKNEWVHLTLVPRSAAGTGSSGVFRISTAGTLVGLEAPPPSRNVEAKPYAISALQTNLQATPPTENDLEADWGLDMKWGVTENLTADFTLNTDFAQVEVDEQQVNLTRFNLFFPEKREFFLEGRGIFNFGGSGFTGPREGSRNVPTLFFSRRIGLQGGEPVSIRGGGRLTGKAGAFDVGTVAVRTGRESGVDAEPTNFTVLRLRRDVLRRSSVGALYADRSRSLVGEGANRSYGVDGSFSFLQDLNLVGYVARTESPGLEDRDLSYNGRVSLDHDRWGFEVQHLRVGENFNPEIGFVRRRGFQESRLGGRFSPRPASLESVRKLFLETGIDYLTHDREGFLEARERRGHVQVEFESSDVFAVTLVDSYERLANPFAIGPDVTLSPGSYRYRDVKVAYNFGLQRRLSGNLTLERGSFFNGDRTSVALTQGRVGVLPQLSLQPSVSFNWVDLEEGSFTAHLLATRVNYSFSPRMFVSALLQYNTQAEVVGSNLRFRWEYAPGSEIFLVYTEDRGTYVHDRFTELSNRGFVIKVNRLFRI